MKPIKLTEAAIRNHEELFPNHQSTLQKTDPEFIELFDNWAFDEVIRHSRLDTKTRVMVILASTVASQALGEYKVIVNAALNVGVTPVAIKEILYQSVAYVGIAKAFDFLHATNELFQGKGIALPLKANPPPRRKRGTNGVWHYKSPFLGTAFSKCVKRHPRTNFTFRTFCLRIALAITTRGAAWI